MSDPISIATASSDFRAQLGDAAKALNEIILGKSEQIDLALTCLLANGHLLIEDVPGVGKTTLARALASVLGLDFARVQFTSDLLPADVTGVSVYQKKDVSFRFHTDPVFTQMLLADEINRATPKAQSALLEAMQERQATVDGERHPLPNPFFVVATQNPADQIGTFDLPESQLDRFLMTVNIGYPDAEAERQLLEGVSTTQKILETGNILNAEKIRALQGLVSEVTLAPQLLDYLQALVAYTRESASFVVGLSPRASIAMANAARAHALLKGRDAVYPEDLQVIFPPIATHRLVPRDNAGSRTTTELALQVLDAVAIP